MSFLITTKAVAIENDLWLKTIQAENIKFYMGAIAIKIEGLSKRYRVGLKEEPHDTLFSAISSTIKYPFYQFNKLRKLIRFGAEEAGEDILWAIKDVSFEVQKGDVIGVIGRNGAGKSTLLKILARIVEPTSGKAIIDGRISSLLEVGTGFNRELTGRENIYLNGAILGMKKVEIDRKFDEIVAFSEVERFLDTPVKRYSSGMAVRLAFAVAAHLEPEILLVDEVLAVGDAIFQQKCLGKISGVAKSGKTVLFVSHNMGIINSLCPTSVLLENGTLTDIGASEKITREYLAKQIPRHDGNARTGYLLNSSLLERAKTEGFEFIDISMENIDNPDLGPTTGDPLKISLSYKCNAAFVSPAFAVSIKDIYGQEIFRLNTMPISGFAIESLFPQGIAELLIYSLPLVAGRYFCDVRFIRPAVERIVQMENIIEFDVQASDVYKSGILLNRTKGLIAVRHQWQHSPMV